MIPAKLALWRLGSGLIALPAQVIALFLVFHGAGEAVGPLYERLLPPTGEPTRGRALGVSWRSSAMSAVPERVLGPACGTCPGGKE